MSLPIHRICRSYIFVITKKSIVEIMIMEGDRGEISKQRIHFEKLHLNYRGLFLNIREDFCYVTIRAG